MPQALHHGWIFTLPEWALVDDITLTTLDHRLQEKAITLMQPAKEVLQKIYSAEILYIHPNSFDLWTDFLIQCAQKKALPTKLILLCGSDFSIGMEHMEAILAFLPETHFWIQNWFGSHPHCSFLPIGACQPFTGTIQAKNQLLGISFLLNYIGNPNRQEFFHFLHQHPEVHQYCLARASFKEYCEDLSRCYYSTCPMGEGFDTYRFWETLMVGSIPIVKDHVFYTNLKHQYPSIRFVQVHTWDELPSLLPSLPTKIDAHPIPCLWIDYWEEKLRELKVSGRPETSIKGAEIERGE
jgi:hypothetical protein